MKLILSALFGLILLQTTAFAGSLDNSNAPSSGSGMPSTTAIYNRLDTGADIAIPGTFQEPTAGPAASGRSLAEIASKLPAADNTNGAAVTDVLSGKTFWGLRTDSTWGLKSGTLVMAAMPVSLGVSVTNAVVNVPITVTASFPAAQAGKAATFSATGGTLGATSVTIAGDGTASTTFSSADTGSFNIYAVQGLYAGGAIVTITATPATTYSISGTIFSGGAGQSGVIVGLTGAATNAAVTDASGNYSFTGLANGSYTVTPFKTGYSFMPANISAISVSGADVNNQNFTDIITQAYSCSGTLSPLGRWCDNNNGTIMDMTTGLVWLKDANCNGVKNWVDAEIWATGLANGSCNLNDGSVARNWRVPTAVELLGITQGTEYVRSGTPRLFDNVQPGFHWSSNTENPYIPLSAWGVYMGNGDVHSGSKSEPYYVWPVRAGQ